MQESLWKEESTFNNQAQLKQNHRKQAACTRNLGKGPVLGKRGRNEHRELFSSSKNRAVHLKNMTGRCMLQPVRIKIIKERKKRRQRQV